MVRFRVGRTVASSSLSDSSSSEDSEEVMLAEKESGAVELRVGGLRDMGPRVWGPAAEPDGGVPNDDESLRFRI
jgi:hypothetical protein